MSDPFSPDTIQDDDNSITLEDLVGEGRKYKDPTELAKAYNHADALIARQKAELAERTAEAKVLKDLLEARQQTSSDPAPDPKPVTTEPREQTAPKVESTDLNELVRKELASASEEKRRVDNINAAAEALNNHFGSPAKAQEAIRHRAEQLGVKFEWLRDVASDSPAALFATMGITPSARSNSTPAYRNEIDPGRTRSDVRNFAYFEKIRKETPKLYYSADIRKQMFDSANELGDKFYLS